MKLRSFLITPGVGRGLNLASIRRDCLVERPEHDAPTLTIQLGEPPGHLANA
jgi:hypothetical protein